MKYRIQNLTRKQRFMLLGWVTLIVFPTFGYLLLKWFEGTTVLEVLQLSKIFQWTTFLGLVFGWVYAAVLIGLSKFKSFKEPFDEQSAVIRSLRLNRFQMLFIALCAGFGEEVLFRAAIQTWVGPWVTTVLFIALHGYFNFKSWKRNLPGLLLFPLILVIAFGYEAYGLWFCVAAHASYDYWMLRNTKGETSPIGDFSDDFPSAPHEDI